MYHGGLASQEKRKFARELRRNQTTAEKKMWQVLRRKSLGYRVHRQKIKYGYILDFYCPKLGVAIEIDGAQHDVAKDAQRDRNLARWGIRTVRFANDFVLSRDAFDLLADTVVALKNLEGKGVRRES